MGELAKLEAFERAVYNRKGEDRIAENQAALVALFQCLTTLRSGAHFEGHDRVIAQADATRMASAIVSLFCDPRFVLTREGFDQVAADRCVMETIFAASTYESSDFVFNMVQEDTENLNKYLLLFSTNSKLNLDIEEVFRNDPQGTVSLYLSLIGYAQVYTPEGDARREKLIGMASIFEDVVPNQCLYNALCGAYMHISYAHGPNKHAPKRVFHRMLNKMMAPHVEQLKPGPRLRKDRPTVLVVFEWWHSKHAMFRSYAKSIEQLKRDFRIVGACPGQQSDEESRAIFDEWIVFDDEQMILTKIAQRFQEVKPDVIYYPSIGMAIWVMALASLRLAPIQVMTYGHPATSNSPFIDYGLIEQDCYIKECFAEKIIPLPNNVVRPTPYAKIATRHVPRETDTVRIAVSAMQVKVSWPFIQALQRVQVRATKKVEVWFFAAAHGIGMYSMANELRKLLANVMVQEQQQYEDYMESLAGCDLCLFSFPFGGANSAYDALTLGMPMVSLEGQEPHSRSDASIIRRAGLPEEMIAKNVDEYAEIILRLLDDQERIRIANLVSAVDVDGKFHTEDDSQAFVDAFSRIYRENTVVQVPEFPIFVQEAA